MAEEREHSSDDGAPNPEETDDSDQGDSNCSPVSSDSDENLRKPASTQDATLVDAIHLPRDNSDNSVNDKVENTPPVPEYSDKGEEISTKYNGGPPFSSTPPKAGDGQASAAEGKPPTPLSPLSPKSLSEDVPLNVRPPEKEGLKVFDGKLSKGPDEGSVIQVPMQPLSPQSAVFMSRPAAPPTALVMAPVSAMPTMTEIPYTPSLQHQQYGYIAHQQIHHVQPTGAAVFPSPVTALSPPGAGGRRKIILRLQEDRRLNVKHTRSPSFFFRKSARSLLAEEEKGGEDRGSITVSWFDGTSSTELQEHVKKSVIRKMGLGGSVMLKDMRIIDETMDPPEEIVLSPYIPDGSQFLLRFRTKDTSEPAPKAPRRPSHTPSFSAPVSPSAAPSPSPHPSSVELNKLNAQLLQSRLSGLKPPLGQQVPRSPMKNQDTPDRIAEENNELVENRNEVVKQRRDSDAGSKGSTVYDGDGVMGYSSEDQVEHRLRQLADLLVTDREERSLKRQEEKRQVIFVLANYFVLFLSLIAISAEIQARAPGWSNWLESQLESVQKCSTDQETLFECVSKGDFAGLLASFLLFLTRSAATKRFFLFGFDTPKKLWKVVYEAIVTAFCWGVSYMFIRRGMNPDTRTNFLRKYWKDAVYGSLAGFNASFLKAVLKNLIPEEALEDALQERHIKILSFLPSFH